MLKPISAAIAIGTGGPFGAEGPIIQTGGALGSLVGQVLHTTAVERKVLLACGAAAGMSATFNTPIAGVILAIELLLFEFKSRSFIPLVIASTLATAVHMQLLGAGPMFQVAAMDFGIPHALPFYLVLGPICGLAAVGLSKALYWVEDSFEKLPVRRTVVAGDWGAGAGDHRILCAARVRRGIRHDRRHSQRESGVEDSAGGDDREVCGAGDFAGIGDVGRIAGADVHVERGHGRAVCDDCKSCLSVGTSVAGRVCAGGDGRGVWSGVAGDVFVHHFRV